MEKVKTLKFRCTKVEIEEKTISFLGDANKREAHIHAHFESPDLKPRDGDRSNLSVTLSKDAKERLAEFRLSQTPRNPQTRTLRTAPDAENTMAA